MELNELQKFVIIIVLTGMLLGIGVLTLDQFSRATRDSTVATDANVNLSSGAAFLSQTFCEEVTAITNATATTIVGIDSVEVTNVDTCAISASIPVDMLYNVTYNYGAASDTSTVADSSNSAITPIGTTWLPLIVTVFILAIIMTLVIGSFAGRS